MDPTTTDGLLSAIGVDPTNIGSGAVQAGYNPSNGLDITGLMGSLIGTAGNAYVANQNSQAAQSIAAAQIAATQEQPSNPLAVLTTSSGKTWLIIGGGILALALILRR